MSGNRRDGQTTPPRERLARAAKSAPKAGALDVAPQPDSAQLSPLVDDAATADGDRGDALHRHALKDVEVALAVLGLGGEGLVRGGSHSTRSASDPGAIKPLRG